MAADLSEPGSKRSRRGNPEDGASKPKRVKPPRPRWVRNLKLGLAITFMVGMLAFIILAFLFLKAVADTKPLMAKIEETMDALRTPPSEIVSADGVVLQKLGAEYRDPIHSLSEVPKHVQDAIIAAEDRRFWKHSGVDFWALTRVAFAGAQAGHFSAGGSTLEMQLAKRITSKGEKTFGRKLNDMALAYNISQELSKQEILKLYLNQVFFGSGAYGVKAAAQIYFAKSLDQLTIAEAAMLARCVRRPTVENPFRNLDRSIENRNVVLGEMLHEGMITDEQYQQASTEKVRLNPNRHAGNTQPVMAPYFVNHVRSELLANNPDIKLEEGGYRIMTTLDSRIQRAAESAVRETVQKFAGNKVNTAAFVLINAKGEILAEVGGPDFNKSQYNLIAQGHRQPGSSFKPILYSTAILEDHYTPDTYLSNKPFTYVDPQSGVKWSPKNSSRNENAPGYSMRSALALSINISAAHTILAVGVHNVAELARNAFGFKSPLREFPSLALGASDVSPLEMAQAYSVFMLRGNRATPHTIAGIDDPEKDSIQSANAFVVHNVLNADVCDQMDSMLRSVVTNGTGGAAGVVNEARGKTGTTSDNKDAWFCGYANGLVGIGWVGHQVYNSRTKQYELHPMTSSTFGGTVTARMWAEIMNAVPKDVIASAHQTLMASENRPQGTDMATTGPAAGPDGANKAADPNQVTVVGQDPGAGPDNSSQIPPADGSGPGPDGTAGTPDQAGPGRTAPVDPGQPRSGGDPDTGAPAPPAPTTSGNPAGTPIRRPASTPPSSGAFDPTGGAANHTALDRPPRPSKPPEALVPVEICEDSGLVANQYCPEVVTRYYRRNRVPKRVCKVHHG